MTETTTLSPGKTVAAKPRDPRLDFFRGLGMFIILIAHIPWNPWADWIPARFGFSDAADMFVFCSGMASSIAFGRIFIDAGWLHGTARIVFRIWQVYWAHIGSFFVVFATMIAADSLLGVNRYVDGELLLSDFFQNERERLLGLRTLRFVPNYFDILPMYLAILAMVPVVMGLAKWHRLAAGAFVLASWLAANLLELNFTADPHTGRGWFFNPFGWQLVFFTGFAFVRGWLPAPPVDRRLIALAVGIVVLALPVSCQGGFDCYAGWGYAPALGDIHDGLSHWWIQKTDYGPLRYAHFMSTVYLAYVLAGERGKNLTGPVAELTRQVGQQTLAVFLTGLVAAQILGVLLDEIGRTFLTQLLVNLLGMAILIAAARITSWFKAPPWRKPLPRVAPAATAEAPAPVSSKAV